MDGSCKFPILGSQGEEFFMGRFLFPLNLVVMLPLRGDF